MQQCYLGHHISRSLQYNHKLGSLTYRAEWCYRDKLRDYLARTEHCCEEQTRALEKFKDEKMGQTLDYNVKLSDRQQTAARLAARTLERNTFLHNIEEKIVEKRLLISNIKLAILNMFQVSISSRDQEI